MVTKTDTAAIIIFLLRIDSSSWYHNIVSVWWRISIKVIIVFTTFTCLLGVVVILYGSWIYNYLCNQCLSPLTLWVGTSFMALTAQKWSFMYNSIRINVYCFLNMTISQKGADKVCVSALALYTHAWTPEKKRLILYCFVVK